MFVTKSLIISLLIVLAVTILVFLIIRVLVLWYYKIDERIKLLEKNNRLLADIYKHLKGDDIKEKESLENNVEVLSAANKKKLEVFKTYGLKKGERVAINIDSKELSKISKEDWESLISYNKENEWKTLFIED